MATRAAKTRVDKRQSARIFEIVLLALCLCILALRVTYTEAPTAQMLTLPDSLGDMVYSLTLSGLLIFAFLFWFLWRLLRHGLVYHLTGIEIGLALFAVAALLSAIGASDKRAAISHMAILLGPMFAALLLAQILDTHRRIRVVLSVVAALGIVSAYQCAEQLFVSNAVTIEQYEKTPEMFLEPLGIEAGTFKHFLFDHRLYSRGIRGFFTTSNSAASFTVMASFAAFALLIRGLQDRGSEKRYRRCALLTLAATVLVVAGLFLTQSKGGILAFLVGSAILVILVGIDRWFAGHKRRILIALLAISLVLVVGIGYAAISYGLRHGRLPGGNSMLVRWQYWAASAQMYADHPLVGVGPGNFSEFYSHYKPGAALETVADPHNFLLSLLTQYGPLGLLGFLAAVFVPLWRSIRPGKETPAAADARGRASFKTLALTLLFSVCGFLLLVRPFLMPSSGADSVDVMLYEIVTLYVTPAAMFLVAYLLLAASFEDERTWHRDFAQTTLSAALVGALLAVLLHNLIDFALFEPGVWMAFWVLVACLVASRGREVGLAITVRDVPVVRRLVVVVVAALLGLYFLFAWKPVYDTTVRIQAAQQAASSGRFDTAHHLLDRAVEADSLSSVAANLNGRLYLQQYEHALNKPAALLEGAVDAFQKAVEASPADYKNYEKAATAYGLLGQHEKAYEWYEKAADLYPGCGRLWLELGRTAERLGRTDAALGHYTTAVQIEESYRRQFREMYPEREAVVSRLGEKEYQLAKRRIGELSK